MTTRGGNAFRAKVSTEETRVRNIEVLIKLHELSHAERIIWSSGLTPRHAPILTELRNPELCPPELPNH